MMTTYPGALAQTELPPSSAHEIIRHRNLLNSWLLRLFVLRIELPPSSAHDHSVYRTCTSVRRFCRFFPFCRFIESVSCAVSTPPRGSTPTPGPTLSY